jgi:hypothetical protein
MKIYEVKGPCPEPAVVLSRAAALVKWAAGGM